jgi:O-methyltransferase domain/Dimerisation domain
VPDQPPASELLRLVNGFRLSQAISVAATLGLADLLADGPRSADDLARATDCHPGALYRLLSALASAGVLHEQPERRFALTTLGAGLRSDAADSVAAWARYVGGPYTWLVWGNLLHSVRTGQDAAHQTFGMSAWDYRARHPEQRALFDAAMAEGSRRVAQAVLASYDFGRFGTIVDVGGGNGALLGAILARYPRARGILFDLPQVVAEAPQVLGPLGVADRCRVVGGSFFDAVPGGADCYLMKFILHDWDDDRAVAILETCRRDAPAGCTLLVCERVIGPPNTDPDARFSDLNMLVGPGGRERTEAEWRALLAAGGFALQRVVPTASVIHLLESVPLRPEGRGTSSPPPRAG